MTQQPIQELSSKLSTLKIMVWLIMTSYERSAPTDLMTLSFEQINSLCLDCSEIVAILDA